MRPIGLSRRIGRSKRERGDRLPAQAKIRLRRPPEGRSPVRDLYTLTSSAGALRRRQKLRVFFGFLIVTRFFILVFFFFLPLGFLLPFESFDAELFELLELFEDEREDWASPDPAGTAPAALRLGELRRAASFFLSCAQTLSSSEACFG